MMKELVGKYPDGYEGFHDDVQISWEEPAVSQDNDSAATKGRHSSSRMGEEGMEDEDLADKVQNTTI